MPKNTHVPPIHYPCTMRRASRACVSPRLPAPTTNSPLSQPSLGEGCEIPCSSTGSSLIMAAPRRHIRCFGHIGSSSHTTSQFESSRSPTIQRAESNGWVWKVIFPPHKKKVDLLYWHFEEKNCNESVQQRIRANPTQKKTRSSGFAMDFLYKKAD